MTVKLLQPIHEFLAQNLPKLMLDKEIIHQSSLFVSHSLTNQSNPFFFQVSRCQGYIDLAAATAHGHSASRLIWHGTWGTNAASGRHSSVPIASSAANTPGMWRCTYALGIAARTCTSNVCPIMIDESHSAETVDRTFDDFVNLQWKYELQTLNQNQDSKCRLLDLFTMQSTELPRLWL